MFSDGHGGDIEICSCALLGHFSDQSNIQVKQHNRANFRKYLLCNFLDYSIPLTITTLVSDKID